jgi:hypothetical protein
VESWPLHNFLTLNLRTSNSLSDIVSARSNHEDDNALLMMVLGGVRKSKNLLSSIIIQKKLNFHPVLQCFSSFQKKEKNLKFFN